MGLARLRMLWHALGVMALMVPGVAEEPGGVPEKFREPLTAEVKALETLRDKAVALGLTEETSKLNKLLEFRGRTSEPRSVKLPEDPVALEKLREGFPKDMERIFKERAEKWGALGQGLAKEYPALAVEAWRASLDLDPENKRARKALGQEWSKETSSWVPQDDILRSQGKVLFRGAWVEAAKMQKVRDAELEKFKAGFHVQHNCPDDGHWRFAALLDFNLAVHGSEDDLKRFVEMMRSIHEKVYSRYFPKVQVTAFTVVIHATEKEYMEIAKGREGTGGYYVDGIHTLKTHLEAPGFAIFHEMGHGFIRTNNIKGDTSRLPAWFDESVATFFETFDAQKGTLGTPVGMRVGNLSTMRSGGKIIPLEQFLKLDKFPSVDMYDEGHALVLFLYSRGVLKAFIDRCLAGHCEVAELESLMGMPLSAIEAALGTFVDALPKMAMVEPGSYLLNVGSP